MDTKLEKTLSGKSLLGDQHWPWGYPNWVEKEEIPVKVKPFSLSINTLINKQPITQQVHPTQNTPIEKLTCQDISLICCCGDSLLTGLGVTSNPSKLKNKILSAMVKMNFSLMVPWLISGEHRHNTCITGGGNGVVSAGRLLNSVLNGRLQGLSFKKTVLFSKGNGFNFARTGAQSSNLINQIHTLISNVRKQGVMKEYKLLFIWIGANDIITKSTSYIRIHFENHLVHCLTILKQCVPKLVVCILPIPHFSTLLMGNKLNLEKKQRIDQKTLLVNKILYNVVHEFSWNSNDFKVIWQPIPVDPINQDMLHIQNDQPLFISTLDNVHPSFIAQQLFAKCIWNNLFRGKDEKLENIHDVVNSEWHHPTETDRICFE
ncbi:hypothetical protein HK103_006363 [Boothiomyces macroporosus]|uniref:Uncharacterized protein n=1 Tax=Boothiomyces macroporosus TaxID=261099 RepID=A0AAD5Y4P2_9FUNG|nr:hypothetical protein HK103_006363 [Boothiomyces macroporosus]